MTHLHYLVDPEYIACTLSSPWNPVWTSVTTSVTGQLEIDRKNGYLKIRSSAIDSLDEMITVYTCRNCAMGEASTHEL